MGDKVDFIFIYEENLFLIDFPNMIKNSLIKELKEITPHPYVALHFFYCLYYVNELFCLSSTTNNWK